MTTIVIDCKNKQIAADSQTTSHFTDKEGSIIDYTVHYKHNAKKIHKIGGVYLAGSGDSGAILDAVMHYDTNGSLPKKPSGEWTIAIIQRKQDHLHIDLFRSEIYRTWYGVTKYKVSTSCYLSDSEAYCIGSGKSYAYAGMKMGLSAEESVLLASKCDLYTDSNVNVVDIE
jgi:hypothetical protein